MTGGRCFLPSFEDDCKDGGRNSLKGKVYFSVEFFIFFRSEASTIASGRYRLRPGSRFGNGSALSNLLPQPQTLNVELTLHLVEAALGFPLSEQFCNTFV